MPSGFPPFFAPCSIAGIVTALKATAGARPVVFEIEFLTFSNSTTKMSAMRRYSAALALYVAVVNW